MPVLLAIVLHGRAWGDELKHPVPDAQTQEETLKNVRDIFHAEWLNAKTDHDKLHLAERLVKEAERLTDDPNAAFVLLRIARDVAARVGAMETALRAVERLGQRYEVDVLAMKAEVLERLLPSLQHSSQKEKVADLALALIDAAVLRDDYPQATQLGDLALSAARDSNDRTLTGKVIARQQEIDALAGAYDRIADAWSKLHTEDFLDPLTNQQVGEFLCLNKGDWEKGVSYLALGGDVPICRAAKADLFAQIAANTDIAKTALQVGNQWWELAEQADDTAAEQLRSRAASWYLLAVPSETGLSRTRITVRLQQVQSEGTTVRPIARLQRSREGGAATTPPGIARADGSGAAGSPDHDPATNPAAFDRPAAGVPADRNAPLRFRMLWTFDGKTAIGEFSPQGPITSTLFPFELAAQIAVDPRGPTIYAMHNHDILRYDPKTGRMFEVKPGPTVPDMSWPKAMAFDTKRNRLIVCTRIFHSWWYAYDCDTDEWALLARAGNRESGPVALAYVEREDLLYGLRLGGSSSPSAKLVTFAPDGTDQGQSLSLPANVVSPKFDLAQMVAVAGRLVIAQGQDPRSSEARNSPQPPNCCVVDFESGEVDIVGPMRPQSMAALLPQLKGIPARLVNPPPKTFSPRREDAAPLPENPELAGKSAELHVVGLYEGAEDGFNIGYAEVVVANKEAPVRLCLCAYEKVHWRLKVEPGVVLQKVYLGGESLQLISGVPSNVPVEDHTRPAAEDRYINFAYVDPKKKSNRSEHQQEEDGKRYDALVKRLYAVTRMRIAKFQGDYRYKSPPIRVGTAD